MKILQVRLINGDVHSFDSEVFMEHICDTRGPFVQIVYRGGSHSVAATFSAYTLVSIERVEKEKQ